MGGAETADGQPTEEYTKFMEDFKKGFNAGYDASTQYGQRTAPQGAAESSPLLFLCFKFDVQHVHGM